MMVEKLHVRDRVIVILSELLAESGDMRPDIMRSMAVALGYVVGWIVTPEGEKRAISNIHEMLDMGFDEALKQKRGEDDASE